MCIALFAAVFIGIYIVIPLASPDDQGTLAVMMGVGFVWGALVLDIEAKHVPRSRKAFLVHARVRHAGGRLRAGLCGGCWLARWRHWHWIELLFLAGAILFSAMAEVVFLRRNSKGAKRR